MTGAVASTTIAPTGTSPRGRAADASASASRIHSRVHRQLHRIRLGLLAADTRN